MADIFLEEDTQAGRFLTFALGNETYSIEIRYVTEIIGIQEINAIPEMPEYVKGIINLRGVIIPLIDIRLRFQKDVRAYDDRTCIIVIELNGFPTGFIVDSVTEVLTIPDEDIEELREIHMGPGGRYVRRIGKVDGSVILMLNSEKIISEEVAEIIGAVS